LPTPFVSLEHTLTTADFIRELIEPIVADLGLDLFDLEFGSGQVKVSVDRPGGVDMEAVAATTRAISRALDEADPIAGRYTLEVSSPGLERVLRTPDHYRWAVGQRVAVKTVSTYDGPRRITGTVVSADDHAVVVRVDESAEGDLQLAYDDVDKTRTVFEWGGQPKKGSAAGSKRDNRAKKPTTRDERAKSRR
jgi:ribosome maturation factor RimP